MELILHYINSQTTTQLNTSLAPLMGHNLQSVKYYIPQSTHVIAFKYK